MIKQQVEENVCECEQAGFCPLHNRIKNYSEFQICKGIVGNEQIKKAYIKKWLQPQVKGLGDRVAAGIKRVTFGLVKPCSGCVKRQAKLNQLFPTNFAELCTEPFGEITKHLTYHILPWGGDHSWIWKRNVQKVCEGIEQFNGKRIVSIMTKDNLNHAKVWDAPENVIKEFEKFNVTDVEFKIFKNSRHSREGRRLKGGRP